MKKVSYFCKKSNKISTPLSLASGSFHEAIGTILAMAQFFGVMPVIGVKSKFVSSLRYKQSAWRTILSVICFALLIGYSFVVIIALIMKGFGLDTISE